MSDETTHPQVADQDDQHNHKRTAKPDPLKLSDRFYALSDRQIVAWLELVPESRVLDAGCGGGGMTRLLAEAVGPSGMVVGLDTNPQSLEWGQAQIQQTASSTRIHFQEGNIVQLPFEDNRIDLV